MKRIIIVALFIFISTSVFAQSDTTKYIYCGLTGIEKLTSTKMTVIIDIGQNYNAFKDPRYRDASGNLMVFNSMIDALNFMTSLGWEYVDAYTIGGNAAIRRYDFILKKKL